MRIRCVELHILRPREPNFYSVNTWLGFYAKCGKEEKGRTRKTSAKREGPKSQKKDRKREAAQGTRKEKEAAQGTKEERNAAQGTKEERKAAQGT